MDASSLTGKIYWNDTRIYMKFEFVQMRRQENWLPILMRLVYPGKKKKTEEAIIIMHELSRKSCMVMAWYDF